MSSGRAPGSRPPYPDGPTVSTGPARQRQRARSANTRWAQSPPAAPRSKRCRAVFAEFRSCSEREQSVGRACWHLDACAIPPSAPRSQARPFRVAIKTPSAAPKPSRRNGDPNRDRRVALPPGRRTHHQTVRSLTRSADLQAYPEAGVGHERLAHQRESSSREKIPALSGSQTLQDYLLSG